MSDTPIYLDYAAATPIDPIVLEAMEPYLGAKFYNPSAQYLAAKDVAKDVAKARFVIAGWLGSRPAEIVFTGGGTEANNLAVTGIMNRFPEAHMLVSAVEHEAVMRPAEQYNHGIVPVDSLGIVDLAQLEALINDQTVLISIMYANNEIGTIQPIRHISQFINQVRYQRQKVGNTLPIYLHTDACQAANYLDLHVARLGVDFMTLNAGKMYGPKQSGVLYVKAGIELQPLILGGGQENGLRSGTENVANIIGFAAALDLAQSSREQESRRLQSVQKHFISILLQKFSNSIVNGSLKHRLPNNVHVTFPGQDNERLMMVLDERGIMCATGSACSASSEEPSHVLKAIGLSSNNAQSSIRFSFGKQTTEADINHVIGVLEELLA